MSLHDDILRFISPNRQAYSNPSALKSFLKSFKEFQFKNGEFYFSSSSGRFKPVKVDHYLYLFISSQIVQLKLSWQSDGSLSVSNDYGWTIEPTALRLDSIESLKQHFKAKELVLSFEKERFGVRLEQEITHTAFSKELSRLVDLFELGDSKRSSKIAPLKPTRVPSVKQNQKPAFLADFKPVVLKKQITELDEDDYCEIQDNTPEKYELEFAGNYDSSYSNKIDVKALNMACLVSQFDLTCFKTIDGFISDRTRRLDRHALIETNRLLLDLSNYTTHFSEQIRCCSACTGLITADDSLQRQTLAVLLAKCFTFNDIELLRFDIDFGLGALHGIEVMVLPQGEQLRQDIIERYKSATYFLVLLILLCRDTSDRLKFLELLIDCSAYLFDKVKNLFAFSYVMNALDHELIQRLKDTWFSLKDASPIKYNLFQSLLAKRQLLTNGDLIYLEQQALVPFIYPTALLLAESFPSPGESSQASLIQNDVKTFSAASETHLITNALFFAQNSSVFSKRARLFGEREYENVYFCMEKTPISMLKMAKAKRCQINLSTRLNTLTQTDFHQIIMWSSNPKQYLPKARDSSSTSDLDERLRSINELLVMLSHKVQA